MKRRFSAVVVVALVAVVAWWLWPRGSGNRKANPAAEVTRSPALARAVTPVHEAKGLPGWFGQPGAAPRRVAGVVQLDGKPVAARVVLTSTATEAGAVAPEVVDAGADGAFDFGVQVAASYVVSASRDGASPAMVSINLADPTARPPSDELVLELSPCAHTVGGAVRDASGGVVEDARVRVEQFGELGPAVRSGADGSYLACVPRGRITLVFSAVGYGGVERELDASGHMAYDARLVPEGVVSGQVVSADGGEPIPGALVEIGLRSWSSNERAVGAMTTSGDDGRFRLAGLGAADMTVRAHATGWVMAEGGRALSVRPAQSIDDVVVKMVPASSIAGTVMNGDEPLAGASIRWAPLGGGTGDGAITQADGSFSLDDLSPGAGAFFVRGYEVVEPDELTAVDERTTGVVVRVSPMASIAGQCLRGGAPLPGCGVTARPQGGAGAGTRAGPDGRFELRGLSPATYEVNADSDRAGAFAPSQSVTVDSGERVEGIVFELAFAATVSGTVVNQHNAPVPGARVYLSLVGGEDYGFARTDRDGAFHIDKLSGGGSYAVKVRAPASQALLAPAGAKAHPNVEVPDGDAAITGVRLAVEVEAGVLAGTVVTATGAPVADAQITAQVAAGDQVPNFGGWSDVPRTTTDQNGQFELRVDGPATFAVQAVSPSGAGKVVTGVAMGARDVRIELDPTGAIDGEVVGFSVDPRIELSRYDMRSRGRSVMTADGGRFHAPDLPAGDYRIEATAGLEHVAAEVTVEAGKTATVRLESHGVGKLDVFARDVRTGAPLPGVFCNVQPWSESYHSVMSSQDLSTGSDGRLTMRSPAGRVRLACRGAGKYSTPVVAVEVPRGATVDVAVALVEGDEPDEPADFGFETTATDEALTVSAVVADGPAAGVLQVGDRIDVIDGVRVADVTTRGATDLLAKPAGAALSLTVSRAGDSLDVVVQSGTLAE